MPKSLADPYLQLDRTIYNRLQAEMNKRGRVVPIFSNPVSLTEIASEPAAIVYNKVFEMPDLAQPGGQRAVLDTPVYNTDPVPKITGYRREPFPVFAKLLYHMQFLVDQSHLDDLRYMEAIMRVAFPPQPQNTCLLYDPTGMTLTDEHLTWFYKGYVTRDMPENKQYWRIQVLHFTLAVPFDLTTDVGAIQEITHEVEVNPLRLVP